MTKATNRTLRVDKEALFRLLKYQPHEGQATVHRSRAPRRIVACGVRWGKTVCAAMEGIAAALTPAKRSVGWVVAPTYDLADRVFREIQLALVTHCRHRVEKMREHDRKILLRNLGGGISEIRAKSADNPVSLLGEGLDWLIVDEASRLKPKIWESHLSQRLIDKKGWALLISTPKGKGFLYNLYLLGKRDEHPDYESWNLPSWTNPLLDREIIEAEKERLPARVFDQEYGARFIEGAGAVFHDVRECATGGWKEPAESQLHYAGIDLARVEDYTVMVIVNHQAEVVFMDRFRRLDWAAQLRRLSATSKRFRCRTYVDSTGMGDPIFEALARAGCNVKPFRFTQRSKSMIIDNLSMMIERKQIVLPRPELCPEMLDELEAFEYSLSDAGNVRSGAPSGSHDDIVVALAMAAYWVRPDRTRIGFKII